MLTLKKFSASLFECDVGSGGIAHNGLGLAEGVEFEIQMFNLAPKLNSIPNAEFSTNATLLANPCYAFVLLSH